MYTEDTARRLIGIFEAFNAGLRPGIQEMALAITGTDPALFASCGTELPNAYLCQPRAAMSTDGTITVLLETRCDGRNPHGGGTVDARSLPAYALQELAGSMARAAMESAAGDGTVPGGKQQTGAGSERNVIRHLREGGMAEEDIAASLDEIRSTATRQPRQP